VEVKNMDEAAIVAELEHAFDENHAASDGEKHAVSSGDVAILSDGAPDHEELRTYYFGSSTITVSKIKEIEEKGYFAEDEARAPGAETMPEPYNDEVVVYEGFFITCLDVPPHLALADILLHFQAQLHQLTPNAIAQLSKYFWVIGSFDGVPSGSSFAKRCKLHYQPKTVKTLEGDQIVQYGCLNFHAKRDGSLKLSLVIKNKWSSGWTKSWFYFYVPCRRSFKGGKSIYALHSRMSELDLAIEPEVECPNDDPNDAAFVRGTTTIGGRDAVNEYVACRMYPLAAGFSFKSVPVGMTIMSKVETFLPLFAVGTIAAEHADHFWQRWR
jgi:hypothetical protein